MVKFSFNMAENICNRFLTRRDFMRYLVVGAVRTGIAEVVNSAAFSIQHSKVRDNREKQERESRKALEEGNGLKVKYFTKEILNAGFRITSSADYADNRIAIITGWYTGDAIGGYLLRNKTNFINGMVGGTSFASGKLIDIISTMIALDQMADPRFKEYGFDTYASEQNPFLSPNPSKRDLLILSAISIPLAFFGGTTLHFFGRGYLGASPFIAKNNMKIAHIVNTSMRLGDRVKFHIESGKSEEVIRNFLSKVDGVDNVNV